MGQLINFIIKQKRGGLVFCSVYVKYEMSFYYFRVYGQEAQP